MDEDRVRAIIKEELSNFSPQKKKRTPSKWQQFLKNCTKKQPGELVYTDKVKLCSIEYQDAKNNGGIDKLLSQNGNDQDGQTQTPSKDHTKNQHNINTQHNVNAQHNINNRKNVRSKYEEAIEMSADMSDI